MTDSADELQRLLALHNAYAILDMLRGDDELGLPDLMAGECDECGRAARGLYCFGSFDLCRECRARRARVGRRLAKPEAVSVAAPAPPPEPDLEQILIAQTSRNGDGPEEPIW